MKDIVIHDVIWRPVLDPSNPPFGEAPRKGDSRPPLSEELRADMIQRLNQRTGELVNQALDRNPPKPSTESTTNITRVSTPEFAFYTQQPLSTDEFASVINNLEKAVASRPDANLVLGSFAVKTAEGAVMNVTPHITGGEPPSTQLIVKSNTAGNDVSYPPPESSGLKAMPNFDKATATPFLPKINTEAGERSFTFDNVVHSRSHDGDPYITCVDICLDHGFGYHVALDNVSKLSDTHHSTPVSHMVVSNTIKPIPQHCVGPLTHVDPCLSSYSSAPLLPLSGERPCFGQPCEMYTPPSPTHLPSLGDALKDQKDTARAYSEYSEHHGIVSGTLAKFRNILKEEASRLDREGSPLSLQKSAVLRRKDEEVASQIARIDEAERDPRLDGTIAGLARRDQMLLDSSQRVIPFSERDREVLNQPRHPMLSRITGAPPQSAERVDRAVNEASTRLGALEPIAPRSPGALSAPALVTPATSEAGVSSISAASLFPTSLAPAPDTRTTDSVMRETELADDASAPSEDGALRAHPREHVVPSPSKKEEEEKKEEPSRPG